ncbi:MAG: hypothetical protein RL318_875 [Fibrobacterota bacterium]|jgi:ferrous iron transport protein B
MSTAGTTAASTVTVLLVGAPNAGKTSLYNHLTGSRYKTVNYPGATVEYSLGRLRRFGDAPQEVAGAADCHTPAAIRAVDGIGIMDTPGIISLTPRSADEQVALTALTALGEVLGEGPARPHLVVAAVDATQPGRHLPLVKQLKDAGFPVVVALTMNDLARLQGKEIDANRLSSFLDLPVVEVDGRTGNGTTELSSCIESCLPEAPAEIRMPGALNAQEIQAGFRWADEATAASLRNAAAVQPTRLGFLDRLTLHPVGGLVTFAAVMSGLFWLVFTAAGPLMDLVESFFGWLGTLATANIPEGLLRGLVVDGIVAGGGGVFVFVPQIAILFLAIGLLEDSGYLARGAMTVDRFLSMIGLNGKSFVPLLSGNACAIPAAMAARTIPGRKERLLTLLVIPLMSCSARLPVWGLLLGFLIPAEKAWLGGIALTGIYLASLVFASLVALVGAKILRIPASESGFQVELPQWRPPTFRTVVVSAWDRTVSYVQRAGLTILAISVGFWALMTFPNPENSVMNGLGKLIEPMLAPMGVDWKVGVSLLAAFAAREVFVSALGVIYSVEGAEDATDGLLEVMRNATFEGTNQLVFTPASTVGLIVFFLIALQCMTTVAVMRREVSNKFALGQMVGFVALAWVLSVITVQGLRLIGVP